MIKLAAKARIVGDAEPMVLRLASGVEEGMERHASYLVSGQPPSAVPSGVPRVLGPGADPSLADGAPLAVFIPESLGYLREGDVIRISPHGQHVSVLYRRSSPHNSLLVTERCNSNCIMCSQPPREVDDGYLVDDILEAIPLMDPDTEELGLTGGEPTLLGGRLLEIFEACKHHLPRTAIHVLSNGRRFAHSRFARSVAAIGHKDLVFGIPLYSDIPGRHDFVVQAHGAFDETVRGLLNLARFRVGTEIRVVIHRQTYSRLPQLARFIARNLPFANHVALMGLEMMGYVKMNLETLWIDPVDYQAELCEAVETLDRARVPVSIYNHQLCILDESLWGFAVRSISDWKNEYVPECDGCTVRERCGGFFASAKLRRSEHIAPIEALGQCR